MRKMKLDLEELAVESFETSTARGRGTIAGMMPDIEVQPYAAGAYPVANTYPDCPSPLCVDTPLASCDGSCKPGCGAAVDPAIGAG